MPSACRSFFAAAALFAGGCTTLSERVEQHRETFTALDAATQADIRNGTVREGFTTDMVYMALGKPWRTERDQNGREVWLYRHEPLAAHNETIAGGFSRRVVYDPVKRGPDLIIEPIDEKAFPHKVAHTLRLTFTGDRLAQIERRKG